MSIYAAKYFRQALEETAALVGVDQGVPLGTRDRQDQNPANFQDKTP
jgi:glutathione S-transferase